MNRRRDAGLHRTGTQPATALRPKVLYKAMHPALNIAVKAARVAPARSSPRLAGCGPPEVTTKRQSDFVTEVVQGPPRSPSSKCCARLTPTTQFSRRVRRVRGFAGRIPVDHRPARRHHQLHSRLSPIRRFDRAGAQRPGHAGRRSRPGTQRTVHRQQGPRRLPQ